MLASRVACPVAGCARLLAFQPRGLSETPLYRESSFAIGPAFTAAEPLTLLILELVLERLPALFRNEECLSGGVGAVVHEAASDKAI
jgi:hypothetical protein